MTNQLTEINDNEPNTEQYNTKSGLQVYKSPEIVIITTMVIKTGDTCVPEGNNGIVGS